MDLDNISNQELANELLKAAKSSREDYKRVIGIIRATSLEAIQNGKKCLRLYLKYSDNSHRLNEIYTDDSAGLVKLLESDGFNVHLENPELLKIFWV